MRKGRLTRTSGMTLIEVTLAVAIFSVVIAASAQSIMSLYVAMDVQQDRVAAVHSCRTVMNVVREKRGEFRGGEETDFVNWTNMFSWINTQNSAGWASYLLEQDGSVKLPNHTVRVQLLNVNGGTAVAGDNPLEVHVIASWKDGKGRTSTTRLVTRMTDR